MTDCQLRKLMKSSPDKWQRVLYDEYIAYVYTIAANNLRSCGTAEDIEECVADIFVDIFTALQERPLKDGDLKCIISTIARRTSIDLFRKLSVRNKRNMSIEDMSPCDEPAENNLESDHERSELKKIIFQCVDQLGKPDSSIIIHHYYYGRTSGEIADEFNMTPGSVQKRIQRARKKLKDLLIKAGVDAEW
ncbi:MAG: RNA polymerase sigma factor [Ruminococcus sp.]|nr:RNA polymerase sigma factor [Ruminococcus sp.]